MTLEPQQRQRLEFLCRVTEKEVKHLLDTDRRLFADLFTVEIGGCRYFARHTSSH